MLFEGRPIGVTPPTFVELVVTETEPGFKGDSSGNTTKPATCETGLQVNVPLFVNAGDKLKVDTRTGDLRGARQRLSDRVAAPADPAVLQVVALRAVIL